MQSNLVMRGEASVIKPRKAVDGGYAANRTTQGQLWRAAMGGERQLPNSAFNSDMAVACLAGRMGGSERPA